METIPAVLEQEEDSAISGPTALVFDVMRYATHDGPGIRTVVFLKGCPLHCLWCHNPESQDFHPDRLYYPDRCRHCLECVAVCPQHAISEVGGELRTSSACTLCGTCANFCMAEARQIAGRQYTVEELIAEVEKDTVFFDESGGGVTLSGGEPLSQAVFVNSFLAACRERGIGTTIETCGFVPADVFQQTALKADIVFFDLKLVDSAKHRQYTGAPNDLILRNLEFLTASRRPLTVRIPVIPGVNDTAQDIAEFAKYLSRLRPPAVELLPYHRAGAEKYARLGRTYQLVDTQPPSPADLAGFRDALAQAGVSVTIRT
jgi:pyruvate formate lyase activating enzyme